MGVELLIRELTASKWLARNEIFLVSGPDQTRGGNITGVGTEVSPPRGRAGVDLVGDVAHGDISTDVLLLETSQQTTSILFISRYDQTSASRHARRRFS